MLKNVLVKEIEGSSIAEVAEFEDANPRVVITFNDKSVLVIERGDTKQVVSYHKHVPIPLYEYSFTYKNEKGEVKEGTIIGVDDAHAKEEAEAIYLDAEEILQVKRGEYLYDL